MHGADAEKAEQNVQREEAPRIGFWNESKLMWKKGIRGRTGLGVFLCAMQQAAGIDGVLYVRFYSPCFVPYFVLTSL